MRVFPLQVNGKLPAHGIGWTLHASSDPDVVRSMWLDPVTGFDLGYNIGFLTNGFVVPDVDTKNGKPGLETFTRLGMDFDTLTMRTPTGGYHLVYDGVGHPVGQSPLGEGVDVRSHNGYVVAPGSTIDGVPYVVELDLPIAPFPEHLRHLLKRPRERGAAPVASIELDQPETVELAAHWLRRDAAPAIEGCNGNDTTYQAACRVRDFGVSEATAFELMLDEYNERCSPPWHPDELHRLVENAYRFAKGEPGAASPAAIFEGVYVVPHPQRDNTPQQLVSTSVAFGNLRPAAEIPQRSWVLRGMLAPSVVTMLVAPGGAGKSLLSLIVAAHLAVGLGFLGFENPGGRRGKSVIYNAEDDLDEMSRRLHGVCVAYGFDPDEVSPMVALLASDTIELRLTRGQAPVIENPEHVRFLTEACADPAVRMLSVDPLVEVHTGRESDSGDMRDVMGVLRKVARTTETAVLVVSHTGKPPNAQSSQAGDQMAGRGSSAMPAAARVVLTMFSATTADCLDIGARLADRASYVRLDGAKATALSAAERTRTRWLRWESRPIANGDDVGVLVEHDADGAFTSAARALASDVAVAMLAAATSAMTIEDVTTVLQERIDPSAEPETRDEVRNRVVKLLAVPVWLPGHGTVALIDDRSSGRRTQKVVIR